MCKHCANLIEDKDVVHRFFELGAQRLNEVVPKRMGRPLHRPITADDIDCPVLNVTAYFWQEPGGVAGQATEKVYRLLMEMDDHSYYRLLQPAKPFTAEKTETLRVELEKLAKKES